MQVILALGFSPFVQQALTSGLRLKCQRVDIPCVECRNDCVKYHKDYRSISSFFLGNPASEYECTLGQGHYGSFCILGLAENSAKQEVSFNHSSKYELHRLTEHSNCQNYTIQLYNYTILLYNFVIQFIYNLL